MLDAAARSASPEDAKQLRNLSGAYSKLGRAYSVGTSPGTKASDAYERLITAANFDRGAGGEFVGEIEQTIAQIAPKAAVQYMGAQRYEQAAQAARRAENQDNPSVVAVRDKLEQAARELYNEAVAEKDTNPEAAKTKLLRVRAIVDSKSPYFKKAGKLLEKS